MERSSAKKNFIRKLGIYPAQNFWQKSSGLYKALILLNFKLAALDHCLEMRQGLGQGFNISNNLKLK